jgi:hypothetical protein
MMFRRVLGTLRSNSMLCDLGWLPLPRHTYHKVKYRMQVSISLCDPSLGRFLVPSMLSLQVFGMDVATALEHLHGRCRTD